MQVVAASTGGVVPVEVVPWWWHTCIRLSVAQHAHHQHHRTTGHHRRARGLEGGRGAGGGGEREVERGREGGSVGLAPLCLAVVLVLWFSSVVVLSGARWCWDGGGGSSTDVD